MIAASAGISDDISRSQSPLSGTPWRFASSTIFTGCDNGAPPAATGAVHLLRAHARGGREMMRSILGGKTGGNDHLFRFAEHAEVARDVRSAQSIVLPHRESELGARSKEAIRLVHARVTRSSTSTPMYDVGVQE